MNSTTRVSVSFNQSPAWAVFKAPVDAWFGGYTVILSKSIQYMDIFTILSPIYLYIVIYIYGYNYNIIMYPSAILLSESTIKIPILTSRQKGTTSRVLRRWLDGWHSARGSAWQGLQARTNHRLCQMLTDARLPRIAWSLCKSYLNIFNTFPNFDLRLAKQ